MSWRTGAMWLMASLAFWGCLISLGWSSGAVFTSTTPSMMRDPAYQAATLRLAKLDTSVVVILGDATFQDHWIKGDAPLHRVYISQYDLNDLTDALDQILTMPAHRLTGICHIIAQSDPLFTLRMRHWGPKLKPLAPIPEGGTTLFSLASIRAFFAHAKAWAAADRRHTPSKIPAARAITLDGQAREPDPTNENWNGVLNRAAVLSQPLTLVTDLDGRDYPEAMTSAYAALPHPDDIGLTRRAAPLQPMPPSCGE